MSADTTGGYIPKTISKKQASDTGMAMVLILLLLAVFLKNDLYLKLAIPALIINMIVPRFFYPFAIVWLGFSNIMGTIASKVILTVVYIVLVVPIGLFRRLLGKDSLNLSGFKKGSESVMKTRNHNFSAEDIDKPY